MEAAFSKRKASKSTTITFSIPSPIKPAAADNPIGPALAKIAGTVDVYGQELPNIDVFIDTAGALELISEVMRIVKPFARIAIIAVYKEDVPFSLLQVMSKELTIVGASGYTNEDILKVIDHINNKKTPISNIVTHVFGLDELQTAFETAIAAKDTVKVVNDLTK